MQVDCSVNEGLITASNQCQCDEAMICIATIAWRWQLSANASQLWLWLQNLIKSVVNMFAAARKFVISEKPFSLIDEMSCLLCWCFCCYTESAAKHDAELWCRTKGRKYLPKPVAFSLFQCFSQSNNISNTSDFVTNHFRRTCVTEIERASRKACFNDDGNKQFRLAINQSWFVFLSVVFMETQKHLWIDLIIWFKTRL